MYKVFSGERCILVSGKKIKADHKDIKLLRFASAEAFHREYKQFVRSSGLKKLIVIGDEEKIWQVFRSFFSYIEASGGLVKNEKGELLMIYRNGHWDLPKGKMEKGELPEETSLREVQEECGVKKLTIIKPLNSSYHIFFQSNKECMKRTYWFEMTCKDSAKPVPQAEEGITEAQWMSKEEVKKIIHKVYPSLQEILEPLLK
ncbi:MAG: NUDIX domain-containing protein [Bacteroidetes bacterium]|nr:NUDIX domain-containing protein [Bacteroidota bacterium]